MEKLTKPNFNDWFDSDSYNADRTAEELEWNLTNKLDFNIPNIDWDDFELPSDLVEAIKKTPVKLTEEDLTSREPRGKGMFDALMESCSKHLKEEYEAGRITGAEYTKAYTFCIQTSMESAIQYLSYRDTSYWQAINAQLAAIKASVDIALAKIGVTSQLVNAHQTRASYALTKLKLASEFANVNMLVEATEEKRASTQDTRLCDSRTVEGIVGTQNKLVRQQIKSFKDDAKIKYIKELSSAFAVQKTADETLQPPSAFTSSAIDSKYSETWTSINEEGES